MGQAKRDDNRIPTLLGVSNADGTTPVTVYADPTTHRLLVSTSGGSLAGLSDVTFTGTAQGDVIYYNGTKWVNLAAGSSGQFLETLGAGANPTWANPSAGAAGSDTQVQFNDGGTTLGGDAGFTYNKTTDTATLVGAIKVGTANIADTAGGQYLKLTAGSDLSVDRAFTITTGDAARTLSMTGNITTAADFITSGANSLTLTTSAATNVTLPTTGTLATLAGTEILTNKTIGNTNTVTFKDTLFTIQDDGDATKLIAFQASGITTGNTRTITVPDSNTTLPIASQIVTISGPTAARTYTFPDAAATIARTDAGQTFTGVNVFTSPKIITQISDTNGNILVNIGATGSAVNYVKITNAATGTAGPILAADGETNVDLKLAGKGTGAVHITTGSYGDLTADSDGSTITFNLATSNIHTVTLGGNRTLALSNEHVGQCFMLRLLQDGTGSRTITWFTTIKWAGGSAPTLTTTASKADLLGFIVTSAGNYDGFVVGANI